MSWYFPRLLASMGIVFLTVPASIFAFQSSSGGYTIDSQANPGGNSWSGGGYTIQSGTATINRISQASGYSIIGGAYREAYLNVDNDGVSDAEEIKGLNGGDGNDDSIPDALQANVVTVPGWTNGHAIAIETTAGNCNIISSFHDTVESAQPVQDPSYIYPIGLIDFHLSCINPGDSASVRIFFDSDYSATSSSWVFRKWDGAGWTTLSTQPTLGTYTFLNGPMAGTTVTTATYSQVDGGANDDDATANSTIVDPIGPALFVAPVVTPSGGGGGGGGGGGSYTGTTTTTANTCTNRAYRTCALTTNAIGFKTYKDNLLCEKFLDAKDSEEAYGYQTNALRKDVLHIAVKMTKKPLIQPTDYKSTFTDIGLPGQAAWLKQTVETGLAYKLITGANKEFRPSSNVSRAEAYAMIMSSVCLKPTGTNADWQKNIWQTAKTYGLTSRDLAAFEPTKPVLTQELFVIAGKAADWAEKTGGCNPRPAACLADYTKTLRPAVITTYDFLQSAPVVDPGARNQLPGTFVYLYETQYHQVFSYVIKKWGIPDGVRQAYINTYGGSKVSINRISIRDIAGNPLPENQWILAGETVYLYLRIGE